MSNPLKLTFWALIVVFLFIACEFFIPAVRDIFRGSKLFLLPLIVFFLLGGVLLFLSIKDKTKGKLRIFLIITGVSAAGFFIGVLLHNLFYALAVITRNIVVVNQLMQVFHVFFFLVSILICPLGFLIGSIGSIALFIKKGKKL